ncbi:MAG: hypothetical protein J6U23_12295, partial [Clostridiales bacterium]|nr:hypothetical protein [Clostridiales bacterium]
DFFYVLKDVEPNIRHTWDVRILTHGIAQTFIDVNHAHITLEGQRMFADETFDGFVEARDNLILEAIGGLKLVSISDEALVNVASIIENDALDDLALLDLGSMQIEQLSEGTGVLAPHIYLEGGFFIATEGDDLLCTEDDIRLITE